MSASDDIKVFLEEKTGVSGSNWKRLSKKKEGDIIVREFELKNDGRLIKVSEDDSGSFSIISDSAKPSMDSNNDKSEKSIPILTIDQIIDLIEVAGEMDRFCSGNKQATSTFKSEMKKNLLAKKFDEITAEAIISYSNSPKDSTEIDEAGYSFLYSEENKKTILANTWIYPDAGSEKDNLHFTIEDKTNRRGGDNGEYLALVLPIMKDIMSKFSLELDDDIEDGFRVDVGQSEEGKTRRIGEAFALEGLFYAQPYDKHDCCEDERLVAFIEGNRGVKPNIKKSNSDVEPPSMETKFKELAIKAYLEYDSASDRQLAEAAKKNPGEVAKLYAFCVVDGQVAISPECVLAQNKGQLYDGEMSPLYVLFKGEISQLTEGVFEIEEPGRGGLHQYLLSKGLRFDSSLANGEDIDMGEQIRDKRGGDIIEDVHTPPNEEEMASLSKLKDMATNLICVAEIALRCMNSGSAPIPLKPTDTQVVDALIVAAVGLSELATGMSKETSVLREAGKVALPMIISPETEAFSIMAGGKPMSILLKDACRTKFVDDKFILVAQGPQGKREAALPLNLIPGVPKNATPDFLTNSFRARKGLSQYLNTALSILEKLPAQESNRERPKKHSI